MPAERMPIPSRRRCLELGAAVLEAELHRIRASAVEAYKTAERLGSLPLPLSTSHEADLMKAVEWATAAAILRALAERADG